jgi:hypothetical protein
MNNIKVHNIVYKHNLGFFFNEGFMNYSHALLASAGLDLVVSLMLSWA